jgi:hypothetical protein
MRKLFGSDEKFDMNVIGNVDTTNLVVQDLYQSYQKNREKEKQEEEEKRKNEEAKQRRDELINQYGHKKGDELFTHELRLERELQEMGREDFENKRAAERAKDPFAPIDKALSGVFVSLGRGLGQGMKDVIEAIKSGAETAFDGVKTAGKLAAAGVGWMIDGAAALGKSAKDAVSGWMSDDEENSVQELKKTETEKAKENKVKTKDVGKSLATLSELASQKREGYALQEIEKALKNIPGGVKLNAKKILSKSCNALTMWITLKEAGANVGEFGDFFEKQVKAENIRAKDAYTGSPYKISSHYTIDGGKVDVGFIDGRNNPVEGFNKYEKLLKSGQVTHGEVYFKTFASHHALSVYSSQGEIKLADVSWRTNGSLAGRYVNAKKENFKWFFYVKNGRR